MALADPALSLDGVIVLVDASACLAHAADPLLADSLQRQLRAADLIVVNKTDRVDADGRQRVRDWLAAIVGKTPCFETTQADVPMLLLSGSALSLGGHARADTGNPPTPRPKTPKPKDQKKNHNLFNPKGTFFLNACFWPPAVFPGGGR